MLWAFLPGPAIYWRIFKERRIALSALKSRELGPAKALVEPGLPGPKRLRISSWLVAAEQDVLLDAAAGLVDDDPVSADFAGQAGPFFAAAFLTIFLTAS